MYCYGFRNNRPVQLAYALEWLEGMDLQLRKKMPSNDRKLPFIGADIDKGFWVGELERFDVLDRRHYTARQGRPKGGLCQCRQVLRQAIDR